MQITFFCSQVSDHHHHHHLHMLKSRKVCNKSNFSLTCLTYLNYKTVDEKLYTTVKWAIAMTQGFFLIDGCVIKKRAVAN